jgi:hypothetical protein
LQVTSDRVKYEWRSRTSNDDGYSFLDVFLQGQTYWSEILVSWQATSGFAYMNKGEGAFSYPIDFSVNPGAFHTFQVESDGTTYVMLIDGVALLQQELVDASGRLAQVTFGYCKNENHMAGSGTWDYVRVFDIPEPCSGVLVFLGCCSAICCSRRRLLPPGSLTRSTARQYHEGGTR